MTEAALTASFVQTEIVNADVPAQQGPGAVVAGRADAGGGGGEPCVHPGPRDDGGAFMS